MFIRVRGKRQGDLRQAIGNDARETCVAIRNDETHVKRGRPASKWETCVKVTALS